MPLDDELAALETVARFGTVADAAAWTRALLRAGQAFENCLNCFGHGWRESPKRGRSRCGACKAGAPDLDQGPLPPIDRYGRGGRVERGSWRDRARPIIGPIIGDVLRRTEGQDDKAIRRALREAYPWGQRAMLPYKVWCDEIRRQRGRVTRLPAREARADGPTGDMFPSVFDPVPS